jgi:hypothetical protein
VIENPDNKEFDIYHIVFMTDGGSAYPGKEILDIKHSKIF